MLFFRNPKPVSFAKIRMQILSRWLLKKDENCFVIAFTSRLPREGVSTMAQGLARSFSDINSGKILLLNASRKHPRRARVLDVTDLEGSTNFSDFVIKNKKSGFDTIRIKNSSQNNFSVVDEIANDDLPIPDILFDDDGTLLDVSVGSDTGNEKIRKLLRKLKKIYNIILVDAGSLNNSNGTFWLSNSDVNILVIDCSRTTRESLEYQRGEFENSNISIDGSILNKRKFPIPRSLYWLTR